MHGASGKVGDLLQFSQRYGKTFFGKIPTRGKSFSEAQLAVQGKFKKAIAYAKSSLLNPFLLELYKSKAAGDFKPFNVAVRDFFTPPQVGEITTDQYNGSIGSKIYVNVVDDAAVKSVKVTIIAANNSEVETGNAIVGTDTNLWQYDATVANSSVAGCKLRIVASDHPGNETIAEKLL